jgi:hypothetical protein
MERRWKVLAVTAVAVFMGFLDALALGRVRAAAPAVA